MASEVSSAFSASGVVLKFESFRFFAASSSHALLYPSPSNNIARDFFNGFS